MEAALERLIMEGYSVTFNPYCNNRNEDKIRVCSRRKSPCEIFVGHGFDVTEAFNIMLEKAGRDTDTGERVSSARAVAGNG